MAMKDFSSLNTALSEVTSGDNELVLNRFLDASTSLLNSASELARAYSRSYSQVEVLKTDANGDVTDVTDTVDANREGIPNSVVATSLQKVAEYRKRKSEMAEALSQMQQVRSHHVVETPNTWTDFHVSVTIAHLVVALGMDADHLVHNVDDATEEAPLSVPWRRFYVRAEGLATDANVTLTAEAFIALVEDPNGPQLQLFMDGNNQLHATMVAGGQIYRTASGTTAVTWPGGTWIEHDGVLTIPVPSYRATRYSSDMNFVFEPAIQNASAIRLCHIVQNEAVHAIDPDDLGIAPNLSDLADAVPTL